jgi:hypothetical protein
MLYRCRCFLIASALLIFPFGFSVPASAADLCSAGPCSKVRHLAFLQNKKCGTDKKPAPVGTECSAIGICNGINSDCCARNDTDCLAGKR